MKKVHVLTTRNNPNSDSFNLPLRLHHRQLKAAEIDVKLRFVATESLLDCDTLCLNSKYFRSWGGAGRQDVIEFIGHAREKVGRLLWFDTTDSTGTTQLEVLPYVDGYFKAQVLADRRGYLNTFYGQRIYADYYHREFEVVDDDPHGAQVPASEGELRKIRVSWSSALGDHSHGRLSAAYARARTYLPLPPGRTVSFTPSDSERPMDISCRVGRSHARNTIRVHRDRLVNALEERYGVATAKLPKGQYWRELQRAKIVASPFGWGEITLRDFHTFINGAALLKPDMSHLATWPHLYQDNETYVACRWDLADVGEKIDYLLSDGRYADVARAGQETYRRYLQSENGGAEFRERFLTMLEQDTPTGAVITANGHD